MTVIKFQNPDDNSKPINSRDTNNNTPNQMDLYSQLMHSRNSDTFTMIIGDNTYVASKQAMMSVISYYIGLMKMREMSLMPGFGEMPHPPVNPPHVDNPDMNNGIVPPPPCPKDDVRK